MSAIWRLILEEEPGDGAYNMALDRAIQLAHAADGSLPTLRLYRWRVPTVTLGRFQDALGVDPEACAEYGVDVVRRFTGGRGVLHDDELTYSVVAGVTDGVPRGVAASYRMLCGALVEAYAGLGVAADLTARPRGSASSAACYLHATHADLSIGAAKLSGSAQVWHGESVLQHGSFTRSRDLAREARVFRLDDDAAAALAESTRTLADLLELVPTTDKMAEEVASGFERALGIVFEPGTPSDRELEVAEGLLGEVKV